MKIAGASVFVTGGAGFIGSHIVESLVRAGAEVTVYDNFSSGLAENLQHISDHLSIIEGDILDKELLTRSMRGADIVSHQAAQLEITRALENPADDLMSNTVGTLNVLDACLANNVQKLINASSACVYGQAHYTPEDEAKHPTNPNWAYGVSKLAAEKYCQIYHELHELPTVSFRYGIVYGPREWYGRVLTIFLKRALEGKPLVIFGAGDQLRDFTYVGDVVAMHNHCILDDAANGEVFNVATGIATSVAQLATTVQKVTGADVAIEHEDIAPGETSTRLDRMRLPSELQAMVLSPEKAKHILGWEPRVALIDGLQAEWEWLQNAHDRWTVMSY